jgi:hypothetical protein
MKKKKNFLRKKKINSLKKEEFMNKYHEFIYFVQMILKYNRFKFKDKSYLIKLEL